MCYALKNPDNCSAIHGSHFFFKSGWLRPPSCALGTSFYTVSEGRDLMTYVSDNYTSYSALSPLKVCLSAATSDIIQAVCGCVAGTGPLSNCKHLGALCSWFYLLGGWGGKVLPQTQHLPPQKIFKYKITQSAQRC